ncbi:MAG: permease-like cell division protein FtsX [Candidatus Saccharibacteria bacterium]|nr:permease-like cell division protein FtsX [Candidatus Saccharibacteria bacterium]
MTKDQKTIDNLKTMEKNNSHHTLRNGRRILKYGFIGYGRNIWLSLTSTIVMSLTLILLFVTIIASLMLSSTAEVMREKIDITIFFKPGTSTSMLEKMANTMRKDSNVRNVEYSTTEEEYQKFIEEQKDNTELMDLLENDEDGALKELMMAGLQSTMRIKVVDAEDLTSVKDIVDNNEDFVENLDASREPTYDTNNAAIDTIVNWSNIARVGGLGLSGLFLVISILVIFNTIRMAIYSRSEEIYMEKLVGANNSFIRGPFLVEASISGIIAGILSAIISFVAFNALTPKLESYDIDVSKVSAFINIDHIALILLAFIGIGVIIALTSSRLAVHKYLRRM